MKPPAAVVDAHVHFWNPELLRYKWLDDLPALNRPFLPSDFSAASERAGVVEMIFVEAGRECSQSLAEVDWISALAKVEPRLRAIVAHAPMENGSSVRDHLTQLASRPLVKGIRRLLQGDDVDLCLRPEFIAGVKLLNEFGFSFDLCIRHEQLRAVTELARRVPEVQFVLDHFGKPPVHAGQLHPWTAELNALATCPNVACKISGLATEADWKAWRPADLEPYFDVALQAFGADRVLFGGDWPVSTLATDYQHWLDTVSELTASATDAERDKLFRLNAKRIYRT